MLGAVAEMLGVALDDYETAALPNHPLGGLPEDLDVAHAIAWLLSDEARWVTGVALPIDAGFSVR